MKLLKGLKVIEIAGVLAGPAVGMFLAELGAEVVKIENPRTGGDVTRHWRNSREEPGASLSAYYASVNWGKEVRMLDLSTQQGRGEVIAMLKEADIAICNFKPGSADQFGLDYISLSRLNPKLIYAQVNGFPDGNPRPAFDVVLQAEAGFLYMTGHADGEPAKMPVALIDVLAAHQLKEGILLALIQRQRTGEGALVQTSLLESALASLANQATNWLMSGMIPSRMGCAHPNIAPYGDLFTCADGGRVVIAAGTQRQFEQLCACLELPHLAKDDRFTTNQRRVDHRKALAEILEKRMEAIHSHILMDRLSEAGVPAGRLRDMEEVFELDAAKAMILKDEPMPGFWAKRLQTVAFSISTRHQLT